MELQIFVVALLVQAKSGGDLVELLDNLAHDPQTAQAEGPVRALTGEGRMQARVLIILPVAALFGIITSRPTMPNAARSAMAFSSYSGCPSSGRILGP